MSEASQSNTFGVGSVWQEPIIMFIYRGKSSVLVPAPEKSDVRQTFN